MTEFYALIHAIKQKTRRGWTREGVKNPKDTIASHSYGAALIGWVLARREGLDAERVMKMLLLHDLIMAFVHDHLPDEAGFVQKKQEEAVALPRLVEALPEEIREESFQLLQEFEAHETDEAKLAKECDKLETILQAHSYNAEIPHLVESFLEGFKDKIQRESTRAVLAELSKAIP